MPMWRSKGRPKEEANGEARGGGQRVRPEGETKGEAREGSKGETKGDAKVGGQRGRLKGRQAYSPIRLPRYHVAAQHVAYETIKHISHGGHGPLPPLIHQRRHTRVYTNLNIHTYK